MTRYTREREVELERELYLERELGVGVGGELIRVEHGCMWR